MEGRFAEEVGRYEVHGVLRVGGGADTKERGKGILRTLLK